MDFCFSPYQTEWRDGYVNQLPEQSNTNSSTTLCMYLYKICITNLTYLFNLIYNS